jgi:hypothetical protein
MTPIAGILRRKPPPAAPRGSGRVGSGREHHLTNRGISRERRGPGCLGDGSALTLCYSPELLVSSDREAKVIGSSCVQPCVPPRHLPPPTGVEPFGRLAERSPTAKVVRSAGDTLPCCFAGRPSQPPPTEIRAAEAANPRLPVSTSVVRAASGGVRMVRSRISNRSIRLTT